jgi:5-methylthioadenosine/S-adenosylhomocysteine deaminase
MAKLIIQNGNVLTMDREATIIKDAVLIVDGSRISYVGPKSKAPLVEAEKLDAGGGLIMPGLINCHTHASMTLMRGMADDLPLEVWLTEHIFPAETKLTPEAVYAGAMLACVEMIKNGTTSFCDMYLHARQVGRAAEESGLRAVVGEVIYDFPSPAYGELDNGFAWSQELIKGYQGHGRVRGAIMPHAPYTCSPSLLEKAAQISADLDADLNIHLAETQNETSQILEKYDKRPLDYLQDLGLVNHRLWIDHGVDLNEDEVARLAEAGARVAHCPESNMKLASGVAPLELYKKYDVALGLGTDGCCSNNDLDLFCEMDSCAKLHKVHNLDPTAAPADYVLGMATSQGARCFGWENLGCLEAGALADIIVVDTSRPHLSPIYSPYSSLVYAAKGSDVRHTVCHGEVLMKDKKLTKLDESEVMARAWEQVRDLGYRD